MNNRIMKVLLPSSALLFSFFVANAQADTITYTQDGSDFTTLPSAWTPLTPTSETGTVYVTEYGSVASVYRSPYENVSVGTIPTDGGGWALAGYQALPYTSIEANGSATYDFGGPENQLTILWGSPDLYNTLTFLDQNGNPIGSLTAGSTAPIVTGDPLTPQTLGHDFLTFLDTGFFYGVVLTTGQNAFEFADLQANLVIDGGANTTPLPTALPLFASGLVAMGLLGWRRKRKPQAAAA
jgi:hypothetical protein